jgi:hypothetical protein
LLITEAGTPSRAISRSCCTDSRVQGVSLIVASVSLTVPPARVAGGRGVGENRGAARPRREQGPGSPTLGELGVDVRQGALELQAHHRGGHALAGHLAQLLHRFEGLMAAMCAAARGNVKPKRPAVAGRPAKP